VEYDGIDATRWSEREVWNVLPYPRSDDRVRIRLDNIRDVSDVWFPDVAY